MKLSESIKPISYLKAHAADIVRNIGKLGGPLIITQNGEAKAVILDIDEYEKTQEAIAMLKILALGERQIAEGKCEPMADVFARIRQRREPK